MSQHLPPLRRVDLQIRPGCGQAYTVEVRYGDLDTLGHVNNVAMVRVLEEGRSRMVADHRLFDGLDVLTPHVVGHQIDYMGETFYGADTTVSAGVAHVGPTRIRFLTTARQGERLVAASIIAIELHGHNGTAVPIPQIVRDRLTPLQLSPEMLAGR